MAFRLKDCGAKQLVTYLEEVNPEKVSHIMDDLIKPMHESKTAKYPVRVKVGSDFVLVKYPKSEKLSSLKEKGPLEQKLFNAREIVKYMDKEAAEQAYEAQQAAEKNTHIERRAKELQDLYG